MFHFSPIQASSEDLVIDKFVGIMLNDFIQEVTLLHTDDTLTTYIASDSSVLSGNNIFKNGKESYLLMSNGHKPPEKIQSFRYIA